MFSEKSIQQPMGRDAEIHSQILFCIHEVFWRDGKKIKEPEEDRDLIGRPTESTNLNSWVISRSPINKWAWAEPRSPALCIADKQLGLQQLDSSWICCLSPCGSRSPKWIALSGLSERGCASFCSDLMKECVGDRVGRVVVGRHGDT